MRLGAVEVVPETFEASLQLGGRVLEALGASDDAVAHRLASMRDQFEEAIKTGDRPLQDAAANTSRAQRHVVSSTRTQRLRAALRRVVAHALRH